MIVGIDEVGRGPWAGPLVVGAVVLGDVDISGLTDSKKLTKKRREELNAEILERAAGVGLGWVHADELDTLGMSKSLVEATKRAVGQITVPYHEIIIDGTVNFLKDTGKGPYVTTLKKADLLISSVSAASIVAKVARDMFMAEQDTLYPGYGFAAHVGYGTVLHREAIAKHGITPLHRLSFAPLAKYRNVSNDKNNKAASKVLPTTKVIGDEAEMVAERYLKAKGYTILGRNWKTKFCEIDIIARKGGITFFVEVKHRKNARHGGGMAAITPKKLRQMTFAAQLYAMKNVSYVGDFQLAVVTTTGVEPSFETFLLLK